MTVAAGLDLPLAKPRDTVELPSGRIGTVMAVLPDHRREVQYLAGDRGSVILKAELLKVRVSVTPRPWQEKVKP